MAKLTNGQRMQVGFILAIAFLLVLGSNRLDQRHFSNIQTTVNSVFKDRVVVQDFIYQLNNIFHKKELRLLLNDDFKAITSENQKVEQLLIDFSTTKLTLKESNLLKDLNIGFSKLSVLENKIAVSPTGIISDNGTIAIKTLMQIQRELDGLAEIQLNESAQLTQLSKKSLGMNMLISQLEVAFLIIIGIAMLVLIFYPIKKASALM